MQQGLEILGHVRGVYRALLGTISLHTLSLYVVAMDQMPACLVECISVDLRLLRKRLAIGRAKIMDLPVPVPRRQVRTSAHKVLRAEAARRGRCTPCTPLRLITDNTACCIPITHSWHTVRAQDLSPQQPQARYREPEQLRMLSIAYDQDTWYYIQAASLNWSHRGSKGSRGAMISTSYEGG